MIKALKNILQIIAMLLMTYVIIAIIVLSVNNGPYEQQIYQEPALVQGCIYNRSLLVNNHKVTIILRDQEVDLYNKTLFYQVSAGDTVTVKYSLLYNHAKKISLGGKVMRVNGVRIK